MIVAVCRLSCKTHGCSIPSEGPACPPLIIRDMNSESVRRYSVIVYKYVPAQRNGIYQFITVRVNSLFDRSVGRPSVHDIVGE